MKILGIVLIVLGALALAWGGISWTDRDTVADLGPIEVQTAEREHIPLPPVVGAVALFAGLIMIFTAGRRRVAV